MSSQLPAGHPEFDWSNWKPAGEGDERSPCPMLNILANHGFLPHDGKGISYEMAVEVLTKGLNLGSGIAGTFASQAVKMNPDKSAHTFDLSHVRQHGVIEHDVSLSRNDFTFGDNHTFNNEIWSRVLETYGESEETSFALASKARYSRLIACKKALEADGKPFTYGIKELILSYGETALLLGIMGDAEHGKIPVKYLKVVFEEERMPIKEGWTKRVEPLQQTNMNHLISSLFMANEHKLDEMRQVGIGTMYAVSTAASGFLGNHCIVM